MSFLKEILIDLVKGGIWWLMGLLALAVMIGYVNNIINPPPKLKYWTIKYADGIYTTDTISYTPVGCVTIPRYTLCGDVIVTEHEGKLPNESFK